MGCTNFNLRERLTLKVRVTGALFKENKAMNQYLISANIKVTTVVILTQRSNTGQHWKRILV